MKSGAIFFGPVRSGHSIKVGIGQILCAIQIRLLWANGSVEEVQDKTLKEGEVVSCIGENC